VVFDEDVDRERLDGSSGVGPEVSELSVLELTLVLIEVEVLGDVGSDDRDELRKVEDEDREETTWRSTKGSFRRMLERTYRICLSAVGRGG